MRHGQTDWNIKSIMQGQTETDLNETGKKQAKEKQKAIEEFNPDVIISSPLKRCLNTVKIAVGDKYKIVTDDRLKERYYGEIEGMHIDEIKEKYPSLKSFTKNGLPYLIECPGGETYEEVYERTKEVIAEVAEKYKGKKVIIISHGDPLDMAESVIMGKDWKEGVGSWHDNTRCVEINFDIDSRGELKSSSDKGEVYVGIEAPEGDGWVQDTDTLDTWFSSGLWTFSTLAKTPDQIKIEDGKLVVDSEDFRNFHPTSVLETGYDILFFWIARMIIMTTYAVEDIPFQDVYLHGLVLDEKGRKMSKSLNNSIDPLDMIKEYGTDAARLSLVIGSTPGNDMNLSEEKIAGFRNFANKLWNIARYVLQTVDNSKQETEINLEKCTLADKWMLSKLNDCVEEVTVDLDNYHFSSVGESLQSLTWNRYADWYLEVAKFQQGSETKKVLLFTLKSLLKLWHPYMPFVTEKIWEEMGEDKLLMIEKWPNSTGIKGQDREQFNIILDIITAIRNARAANGVEPSKKIKAIIYAGNNVDLIKSQETLIKSLRTGINELEVKESGVKIEKEILIPVRDMEIYLIGARDEEKEKERIKKEVENLEKVIKMVKGKLDNKEFVERAPEKVVNMEKEKLEKAEGELKKLKK